MKPRWPRVHSQGLPKTAIRGSNPVLFVECATPYGKHGEVPEGDYVIPFGKADIKRPGNDLTVVAV